MPQIKKWPQEELESQNATSPGGRRKLLFAFGCLTINYLRKIVIDVRVIVIASQFRD